MRAMFKSRFPSADAIREVVSVNSEMISEGGKLYRHHVELMAALAKVSETPYISIYDLYAEIGIKFLSCTSKRLLYKGYDSGIIVGAGSGDDCIDLIGMADWRLFDLTDERMANTAIGYEDGIGSFNSASSAEGDSITEISEKYSKGGIGINFTKIDSLHVEKCGILSIDAEGGGLDVISGAIDTINKFSPDILVSIYHNWIEYLLILPILYDMGYDIQAVKTSNFTPQQPHLELSLFCSKDEK